LAGERHFVPPVQRHDLSKWEYQMGRNVTLSLGALILIIIVVAIVF
jgi:hypothetical protein